MGLRFVFGGSLSLDLGLLLLSRLSCCLLLGLDFGFRDQLNVRFGISRGAELNIFPLWIPDTVNLLLILSVLFGALNVVI